MAEEISPHNFPRFSDGIVCKAANTLPNPKLIFGIVPLTRSCDE